jgi:hypothetical protein
LAKPQWMLVKSVCVSKLTVVPVVKVAIDNSVSLDNTIIGSSCETPIGISDGDINGGDTKFYYFITSIIKLGRKIEMDDVEFKSNKGEISAKFKRMRIE